MLQRCLLLVVLLAAQSLRAETFDFENDKPGSPPAGWSGQAIVVQDGAISGLRSAFLAGRQNNNVLVSPPLPATAGQDYFLSYRLKLTVRTGSLNVQFRCLDAQRKALRPEWLYPPIEQLATSMANPATVSHRVSLKDVEPEAAFVQIVFKWYSQPSGEAWIDDFSWKPIGERPKLAAIRPLDLRPACNMGFKDETEGDGKGGWTDQGHNDMRELRLSPIRLEGIVLNLIDPAQNSGRSCIVLGRDLPHKVSIPVNQKADRIFALHNCAFSGGKSHTAVARWTFIFEDGARSAIDLKLGQDLADWWSPEDTQNSVVAVLAGNPVHAANGLNLAEIANPNPGKTIRSIEVEALDEVMYMLVAATLADGGTAMPFLKLSSNVEFRKADKDWFPCDLPWGAPEEPSPTNMSFLLDKPAGRHGFVQSRDGKFMFEDGTRARFLATTNGWSAWVVSHEDAERMAAYLARMGINLLRIFPQGNIAGDDPATFTLDAEKQEKLDYLLAELKKRGIYIYWYTSTAQLVRSRVCKALCGGKTSQNEAMGMFDPAWLAAEKRYWQLLLTHVNPYTGKSLADDPMMALIEITNEDEPLPRILDAERPIPDSSGKELAARWNQWLVSQYATRAGLQEAWQRMEAKPPLGPDEDPAAGTVPIPGRNQRGRIHDFRRFCAKLYAEFSATMTGHLRSLGVRCPISPTNHIYTADGLFVMATSDFAGMHRYGPYMDGTIYTVPNYSVLKRNDPFYGNSGSFPGVGLLGRLAGKPFTLGEWNIGYPNDFRGGVMQGFAYGLLQDWDCINYFCFFADPRRWQPDQPSVSTSLESAFGVARVGMFPAVAMMFHRQDIQPARTCVRQTFTPSDLERLAKEQGYASDVKYSAKAGAWVPFVYRFEISPSDKAEGKNVIVEKTGGDLADARRAAEDAKRIDEAGHILRSDTGELVSDFKHGILTIDTPRTQAATGHLDEVERLALSQLEIANASTFCNVILTSLDGKKLEESQRILITVTGDSANTDEVAMVPRADLANAEKTGRHHPSRYVFNAGKAGRKPVLAEPVRVELRLKRSAAGPVKCTSLDPSGKPTGDVPVTREEGHVKIGVDGRYRAIYFLVESR